MSDAIVLRRRFGVGERAFTVLGDARFDPARAEWHARLLFVPLDRALPRTVVSGAIKRARRRDDVVRHLGGVSDADLLKAFRGIALPLPRRSRER